MSVRANLGWVRSGASRTEATFATHAAAIGSLQEQVQSLTVAVAGFSENLTRVGATSEEIAEVVDAIRHELRTITDDLGDRVGSISARLESGLGV
ncbi:MAG: hypothetical protein JWR83_774 [Aeromicrobium sp.]|nr:hypothetical protein [Aeromicrobium sp.]